MKFAMLVYQAGIANVFAVERFGWSAEDRGETKRLAQHAFRHCEAFACGLEAAGVRVRSAYCNEAGDIIDREWFAALNDAPFSDEFRPVNTPRSTNRSSR